jgi:diketogulonate reductase-like aldo/keto reductase
METKTLQSGFSMPVVGLGCWPLGGAQNSSPGMSDERDLETLTYALAKGITHFDTAESYAGGHSEELLGRALKDSDRAKLFVSSKISGGSKPERFREACEASLTRIGTDYLDLYYIHWREDWDDLAAQIREMEALKDEGLIQNIGVSNFSTKSLQQAQQLSKYPIVANQVHYNLILREAEKDGLVDYCKKNDVFLVAYRPLELGKIANSPSRVGGTTIKYGKTPAQIGINWLISQKNVVTIFGCLRKEYIDENLGALGSRMDKEDIKNLRENYRGQLFASDCVRLE